VAENRSPLSFSRGTTSQKAFADSCLQKPTFAFGQIGQANAGFVEDQTPGRKSKAWLLA
jgi:hypothetical protein